MAAAGYNFRRIAQWLKALLFKILYALDDLKNLAPAYNQDSSQGTIYGSS